MYLSLRFLLVVIILRHFYDTFTTHILIVIAMFLKAAYFSGYYKYCAPLILLVENSLQVTKINISEEKLEDYFSNLIGGGGIG